MLKRPLWTALAVAIGILVPLAASRATGQQAEKAIDATDFVVLIDVSGSMAGRPLGSGATNIFPQVQRTIQDFLNTVPVGSHVFIVPFSDGIESTTRFTVRGPADRRAAAAHVGRLRARGQRTHVYEAVRTAFDQYLAFRGDQTNRAGFLLVYTDGRDNGPEAMTMKDVARNFSLKRRSHDWLYYATLDVPLPDADRATLGETPNIKHIDNPRGEVKPIQILRPRYANIAFGNLHHGDTDPRVQGFDRNGSQPLPQGFALSARANFDRVTEQGAAVEIDPRALVPGDEVPIALKLVNAQGLESGAYEGTITFSSPDPSVIIEPATIGARFSYLPPRTTRAEWDGSPNSTPLALGSLDPFRAEDGQAETSAPIRMVYNEEAAARGGNFGAQIAQDPANPMPLPDSFFSLNGAPGVQHQITAGTPELNVGFRADREGIEPGTYRGTLMLDDQDLAVDGPREIPWEVTVAERPWTPLHWGILGLGLLMAGALLWGGTRYYQTGSFRRPGLKGTLVIRDKTGEVMPEIPLRGRSMEIGSGTDHLGNAPARLRLIPDQTRHNYTIRVEVLDGNAMVREQGDRSPGAFFSHKLKEGDQLILGPYQAQYSPF